MVSNLYRDAYGAAPEVVDVGERLTGKTMRQYIKSWITDWDIQRLYKERDEIAAEPIPPDYTENKDLELAPVLDGTEGEEP